MENTSNTSKPYTLRKLQAGDIFHITSILHKIGVEKIAQCISIDKIRMLMPGSKTDPARKIEAGFEVGANIISCVIGNIESCKDSLFKFLSGLTGLPAKQIEEMEIDMFMGLLKDIMQMDDFRDFFKAASKFTK